MLSGDFPLLRSLLIERCPNLYSIPRFQFVSERNLNYVLQQDELAWFAITSDLESWLPEISKVLFPAIRTALTSNARIYMLRTSLSPGWPQSPAITKASQIQKLPPAQFR
jgi:hypothetical protein